MANGTPFTNIKLDPNLRDVLDDLRKDIFLNLNCHSIGKIQKVNANNQTVEIKIVYKKTNIVRSRDGDYKQKLEEYPVLLDIPFVNLRGGKAGLSMPIKAGDECLVLYCDRTIDDWFANGIVGALSSNRMHSMSDAIALVGVNSMQNLVEGYDQNRAVLYNDKAKVAVGPVKIEISNDAQNLANILQNLIGKLNELTTQISALTVTGVSGGPGTSGVPSNAAAINAIGADITQIGADLGGLLE
ncbi:putative baseplate protein [Bdellovibrio phage phi1422]|uniref:baseplate spike n=1 Tax=Bdellovibrio phage phi1422 TaxID=1127515 RepID=UPI0002536D73|nr:baseplate spike [Bdellovibrio phage phi1422]AFC22583.1 putative baseplate protein [Bdellovibrio phage phi1422]